MAGCSHRPRHELAGPHGLPDLWKLKARRQCSTLLVDPIYSDAGESSTQELGLEQLVAKIWDPKLMLYEDAMYTNPMLLCQRTYSTEVNAYRQLKGLEEMPTFHGSFITTIDDDDGERIAGLILISFVNGVHISALQMVPEKLFVDLLAMDMKMLMREIAYTDYRKENILAVDDGSKLVLVDYGEAIPSPRAPRSVEEEAMVKRWVRNFCEEDMMGLLGPKGKLDPYPKVDCQWVRGLVQQAIEKCQRGGERRGSARSMLRSGKDIVQLVSNNPTIHVRDSSNMCPAHGDFDPPFV